MIRSIVCRIRSSSSTAARESFPRWLRVLVPVRFALVMLGSAVVITLLALPATAPCFR